MMARQEEIRQFLEEVERRKEWLARQRGAESNLIFGVQTPNTCWQPILLFPTNSPILHEETSIEKKARKRKEKPKFESTLSQLKSKIEHLNNELRALESKFESNLEINNPNILEKEESNAEEAVKEEISQKSSQLERLNEEASKRVAFVRKRHHYKKRLKSKRQKENQLETETTHRKELEIDEWLAKEAEQNEKVKLERETAAEADRVLGDIESKIADVKGIERKLSLLKKARSVLKDEAERKSLFTPVDSDEAFEDKIEQLTAAVERRLDGYRRERQTLEVMLEGRRDDGGDCSRDQARDQAEEEGRARRQLTVEKRKLREALFGAENVKGRFRQKAFRIKSIVFAYFVPVFQKGMKTKF